MLGQRDPAIYGTLTLPALQVRIEGFAAELGLRVVFFQTNHEGELIERLHRLRGEAEGIVVNPGAWTHYAWAIRDALEIAALPAVEVHLSDVKAREQWRRVSVIEDLCIASVAGHGPDGYRLALAPARGTRRGEQNGTRRRGRHAGRRARGRHQRKRACERNILAALLGERELDAVLVGEPVNLRYLSGFTGTNGLALIGGGSRTVPAIRRGSSRTSATTRSPPRNYRTSTSAGSCRSSCSRLPRASSPSRHPPAGAWASTTPRSRSSSTGGCASCWATWELVPCAGLVEGLRELKDASELRRIRGAANSLMRRCAGCSKTASPDAPSATSRSTSSYACAASARGAELPLDRRRGRARRAAARRAARR